jgi:hypothetical protein
LGEKRWRWREKRLKRESSKMQIRGADRHQKTNG